MVAATDMPPWKYRQGQGQGQAQGIGYGTASCIPTVSCQLSTIDPLSTYSTLPNLNLYQHHHSQSIPHETLPLPLTHYYGYGRANNNIDNFGDEGRTGAV